MQVEERFLRCVTALRAGTSVRMTRKFRLEPREDAESKPATAGRIPHSQIAALRSNLQIRFACGVRL
jgi:hypothetical protein